MKDKIVLDACCGSRMFWFDKKDNRALFIDHRKENHIVKDKSQKTGEREVLIQPDIVACFTSIPFNDESFYHVVFDPPHMTSLGDNSWMAKKYGKLIAGWEDMLKSGFSECMRVLKTNGTLIFKWNETEVKVSVLITLFNTLGYKPLYGHISGKHSKTHLIAYIKNHQ